MANRYIGSSERTTALAEGIYLRAALGALPPNKQDEAEKAWLLWVAQWGQEMRTMAEREQYILFDRVNAKEWN